MICMAYIYNICIYKIDVNIKKIYYIYELINTIRHSITFFCKNKIALEMHDFFNAF